ncbi:MAG: hypothetical protein OXC28_05020 [Defluviicoccus sp.]|nr:hypothetical protein [Defluviicoccus sp.]
MKTLGLAVVVTLMLLGVTFVIAEHHRNKPPEVTNTEPGSPATIKRRP